MKVAASASRCRSTVRGARLGRRASSGQGVVPMACVMNFHVVMGQSKRDVGAGLPMTLCRSLGAVTVIFHLAGETEQLSGRCASQGC